MGGKMEERGWKFSLVITPPPRTLTFHTTHNFQYNNYYVHIMNFKNLIYTEKINYNNQLFSYHGA